MPFDTSVRVYTNEHLIGILNEMGIVKKPNYLISSNLILDSPVESLILSSKPPPLFVQQRRVLRGNSRVTSTPTRGATRPTAFTSGNFSKFRNNNQRNEGANVLQNDFDNESFMKNNAKPSDDISDIAQNIIEEIKGIPVDVEFQKLFDKVERNPFVVNKPSHFYSLVHNTMNESSFDFGIPVAVQKKDESESFTNLNDRSLTVPNISTEAEYVTANESQMKAVDEKHELLNDIEAICDDVTSLKNDFNFTDQNTSESSLEQEVLETEKKNDIEDKIVKEESVESNFSFEKTEIVKNQDSKKLADNLQDDGFIGFNEKQKKPQKKKAEQKNINRANNRSSGRNFNNSRGNAPSSRSSNNKSSDIKSENVRSVKKTVNQRGNRVMQPQSDINKLLMESGFKKSIEVKDDRFTTIEDIVKETREREKKETQLKVKPKAPVVVETPPPAEKFLTIEQIAAEQRLEELKGDQDKKGDFWKNVMNMF